MLLLSLCRVDMFVSNELLHLTLWYPSMRAINYAFAFDKYHLCCVYVVFNFQNCFSYSMPFYKIMVPTVDTVRYDFLVYNLLQAKRPVLLTGPVGTGKTSLAQKVLQRLDPKIYSLLVINMSAQVRQRLKLKVAVFVFSLAFPRPSAFAMLFFKVNRGEIKDSNEICLAFRVFLFWYFCI